VPAGFEALFEEKTKKQQKCLKYNNCFIFLPSLDTPVFMHHAFIFVNGKKKTKEKKDMNNTCFIKQIPNCVSTESAMFVLF
jgi:hypothetical protein